MLFRMYVHISICFCIDIDIHIHVNVFVVWLTFGLRVWLPEWVKSCNYWLSLIKSQRKLNHKVESMTGNSVPRFIYTVVCITGMHAATPFSSTVHPLVERISTAPNRCRNTDPKYWRRFLRIMHMIPVLWSVIMLFDNVSDTEVFTTRIMHLFFLFVW